MDTITIKFFSIQDILDLRKEGYSYQKIADRFGVTKNTIIGRVSRFRIANGCDFARSVKYKTIKHQIEHFQNPEGGITIMELKNDTCRYMIGDGRYCGHKTQDRSYCNHHHSICYTGKGKREKVMTPYPIAYDRNTNTWITYSGEFNSYAEALQATKGKVNGN